VLLRITKLTAFLRSPSEFADQLKDVARCIRQSLEGYMRTKFPESWKTDDWLGDMIKKIRDARPGDVLHHAAHLVTGLTEANCDRQRYHRWRDGRSRCAEPLMRPN
ncbi:MAG: hypothetical protein U5O69_02825, partial [Candidatus Competibacteraceae bacterium]|nr:hypothetical protein [Candidatus Competibacteraceae bacterium]